MDGGVRVERSERREEGAAARAVGLRTSSRRAEAGFHDGCDCASDVVRLPDSGPTFEFPRPGCRVHPSSFVVSGVLRVERQGVGS